MHLFLNFPFAVEIWDWITTPLFAIIDLPDSILSLFSSWDLVFPGPLQQKPGLNLNWLSLPKFIIWKIWLERNQHIFKGIAQSTAQKQDPFKPERIKLVIILHTL